MLLLTTCSSPQPCLASAARCPAWCGRLLEAYADQRHVQVLALLVLTRNHHVKMAAPRRQHLLGNSHLHSRARAQHAAPKQHKGGLAAALWTAPSAVHAWCAHSNAAHKLWQLPCSAAAWPPDEAGQDFLAVHADMYVGDPF
eukprot:GHRQ01038110.1.p1 GENE.GHRQ01038110.1~~GHRQ01038110.1.p1  ORF type:complete len:142 (-),score=20.93 GHRQ01038110.1:125-550(-)